MLRTLWMLRVSWMFRILWMLGVFQTGVATAMRRAHYILHADVIHLPFLLFLATGP
ncbi:MAG: hypothetical protein GX492_12910 [Firmicutes bacterium]|nr:hypothetical protein [Bacillota bacterium]NLG80700.1 hypothetical protein [Bacillota bacterium]